MNHGYDYTPRPAGGYRKPNLEGLFDEQTPPLVIRRDYRRGFGHGPPIGERRRKGTWPGATSPAPSSTDPHGPG